MHIADKTVRCPSTLLPRRQGRHKEGDKHYVTFMDIADETTIFPSTQEGDRHYTFMDIADETARHPSTRPKETRKETDITLS